MQSFCAHSFLSAYKQLWLWILFYHCCCRAASCFWLKFWLHQGKSLNAGQPAPGVTPSAAPQSSNSSITDILKLHSPLVLLTTHPHTLSSPRQSQACLLIPRLKWHMTKQWFSSVIYNVTHHIIDSAARNIKSNVNNKKGNLGSKLCMKSDAAAWMRLPFLCLPLLFPLHSPVVVFPRQFCTVSGDAELGDRHAQNSPRGWKRKVQTEVG